MALLLGRCVPWENSSIRHVCLLELQRGGWSWALELGLTGQQLQVVPFAKMQQTFL